MKKIILILLIAAAVSQPVSAQKIRVLPDQAPAAFTTELNRLLADARFDFKNTTDNQKPGTQDEILSSYYSKVQLPLADSSFMEEALDDLLETYHQFIAAFGHYPTREAAKVNFNKIAQYINKGKYNEGQLMQNPTEEKEKSVLQLWSLKTNKPTNASTRVELSMSERKIWPASSKKPELAWVIELCVFEDGGF
jgi:hypothetical protein